MSNIRSMEYYRAMRKDLQHAVYEQGMVITQLELEIQQLKASAELRDQVILDLGRTVHNFVDVIKAMERKLDEYQEVQK